MKHLMFFLICAIICSCSSNVTDKRESASISNETMPIYKSPLDELIMAKGNVRGNIVLQQDLAQDINSKWNNNSFIINELGHRAFELKSMDSAPDGQIYVCFSHFSTILDEVEPDENGMVPIGDCITISLDAIGTISKDDARKLIKGESYILKGSVKSLVDKTTVEEDAYINEINIKLGTIELDSLTFVKL